MSRGAIRLGIIGCGRATLVHHMPALRRATDFELVAVADSDPSALDRIARLAPSVARFDQPAALFNHVDAVAVAAPTPAHAGLAIAALDAGKALLLEKPAVMNLEEAHLVAEAAARAARPVLVAHNGRWHSLVQQARQIVESGRLGRIVGVRSTYTHAHPPPGDHWHRWRSLGGGVLFNDAGHHFDLWRFLTSAEIESIQCHAANSELFEDDTASVSARLSNGALATCLLSFSTTAQSEIEIFGDRASLLVNLYRFDGLHFTGRGELPGAIGVRLREAARFFAALPSGVAALQRGGGFDSSYAAMWRHFADCCRGTAQPLCSLTDGVAAVAASLACLQAASGAPSTNSRPPA